MDFNTRYIRYFLAVADLGSFSRAAEHLNISQPALSLRIQSQEQHIGFSVFDRSGGRVRPTEKGERLLAGFRDILNHAQRVDRLRGELRDGKAGLLRIGVSISSDLPARTRLFAEFARKHPGVEMDLEAGNAVALMRAVLDGLLDLAVVITPPDEYPESLVLQWYPVELIAPADWELVQRHEVATFMLKEVPVVSFRRERHPPLYDRLLQPLADLGTRLVPASDSSAPGMLALAVRRHIAIVSAYPQFEDHQLAAVGMARRPIAIPDVAGLVLIRAHGEIGIGATAFWKFARLTSNGNLTRRLVHAPI